MLYKKIGLISLLSYLVACSIKKDKIENTEVIFEREVYDFGIIPFGTDAAITIDFSNIGVKTMVISNMKSSCGCTVPKLKKNEFLSGKKGAINVNISPTRRGKFSSSVYVFYNGVDSPKKIRIKGEVNYLDLLED